jgi:radical SAM superfamily enzyme YgiQ (UPF0313 family)
MNKILLIRVDLPNDIEKEMTCPPPIGLWSMRTSWEQEGKEIDICDEQIGDKLEDFLSEKEYDMIGISAKFSIQHFEYLNVIRRIKEKGTNAHIVAGGQHAVVTAIPQGVDEIFSGPGESYFNKEKTHVQPKFKLEEIEKYWLLDKPYGGTGTSKAKKWIPFETSRGCTGYCGFCASRHFWGNWKTLPLEEVYEYFSFLSDMGVEELFTLEDYITHDQDRFEKLINMINEFGFKLIAANGFKGRDLLNDKVFDSFIQSNCTEISLPLECHSEEKAKLMRLNDKHLDFDTAFKLISKLNDNGITVTTGVLIGYPGEDIQSMNDSISYIAALPAHTKSALIVTPYPGTAVYNICKRNDWLIMDIPELYYNLKYTKGVIHTPEFSPQQVEKIFNDHRTSEMKKKGLI